MSRLRDLVHVDLFSGIGGIALAAGWAGFRTRLFCEIHPYACRVLARHWPEVPIELSPEYHAIAQKRIQATLTQMAVPSLENPNVHDPLSATA